MSRSALQWQMGRSDVAGDQNPTAGSTGILVLLTRLARTVFAQSSVELVGMNLRNMALLAYLRDHPSVPQQVMTDSLSIDANAGVLLLNDLEQLGYVERRRDRQDRRRHLVDVTAAGLAALERAERAQAGIEDQILGGLSASERSAFQRLLVKACAVHATREP